MNIEIQITTKNRKTELEKTLSSIYKLIDNKHVKCVVFDDGSMDQTSQMVVQDFPSVTLLRNETSRGYIYCRNVMLNESTADIAISLDDDANFITENPLEKISRYFDEEKNCGLIAFRIFWSKQSPSTTITQEKPTRVKGFVGCGHAWRLDSWKKIPNYPEWFVFYGEEEFASYQLFKINHEVHYLPSVLIHHRVDVKARKNNDDYANRLRRSLASGWYLYLLFHPLKSVPRKLIYSFWIQFKYKIVKGDWRATKAIFYAVLDVVINLPKWVKQSCRFTNQEYKHYSKLVDTKIYWIPNEQ